jgi:DNA-binding NarL/FixJ family response regulator
MENVRIVLADDHAVVRSGISNALKDIPNLQIVGEASDGPEVFAALAETNPDCLLIDVTMPDFEPITAIRKIRASYPALKILVVSAYDDDVYVQGLLGIGVDGYHLKDQSLNELQLAVQRILSGKKWVSSRLLDKLVSFGDSSSSLPAAQVLTSRQRDILQFLQQGLDNQTIARRMGLSVKTIEKHLTRLYRQIDVQSRLEAVNYVSQHPEVLSASGAKKPVELPPNPEIAPSPQQQILILLVDDNVRYRRQLRRMVGKVYPNGVTYEAGNIKEAMDLLQHTSPQLALVDVVLGDENGIHCTRRLKALLPQLRVVLITAYPDREFHKQGVEAGAVALLDKKDLDAATLRQVIDDIIIGYN